MKTTLVFIHSVFFLFSFNHLKVIHFWEKSAVPTKEIRKYTLKPFHVLHLKVCNKIVATLMWKVLGKVKLGIAEKYVSEIQMITIADIIIKSLRTNNVRFLVQSIGRP